MQKVVGSNPMNPDTISRSPKARVCRTLLFSMDSRLAGLEVIGLVILFILTG
jgi:hypothetical protein